MLPAGQVGSAASRICAWDRPTLRREAAARRVGSCQLYRRYSATGVLEEPARESKGNTISGHLQGLLALEGASTLNANPLTRLDMTTSILITDLTFPARADSLSPLSLGRGSGLASLGWT